MQEYGAQLKPHHAALLEASAISPQVANAAGIRSVSRPSELPPEFAWLKGRGGTPALVFPWHRISGSDPVLQLRPDSPVDLGDGDKRKYLWPKGAGSVLAVHPAMLERVLDEGVPLVIVEGTKQYLAAASALADESYAVVGVAGCYGWMHDGKPVADFDGIPWAGRKACVCFDADVETKRGVWDAAAALDEALQVRGAAAVGYIKMPALGGAGLDDVLGPAAEKTAMMLNMIGRARPKLPRKPARKLTHSAPPDPPRTAAQLHTADLPGQTPVQPVQLCSDGCDAPPPLAFKSDILTEVDAMAGHLGVTGEQRIVRATYLTFVSQMLQEPGSLVVKGESAGGKSYSTRKVLVLIPDAEVYQFTAGSQRSLIYTEEEFVHRTLVIFEATALREVAEERDGDMTAMLVRTLLSEGRLRYPVTEKGEDGKFVVRMIEKRGPTNLIVTTTADELHHENETRLLSLTIDESPEQTRSVLKKIAERRNRPVPVEPPDTRPWHQLFHWLKHHGEHRVYIPYAGYLAENVSDAVVRMRRDFSTLLAHIEAHAILHQATRLKDGYGRIVATAADYEAARRLLADAFAISSGKQVPESVRKVVQAVMNIIALGDAEALTVQVAAMIERDRTVAARGLSRAVKLGFLENREIKKGRAGRYAPGTQTLPEDTPAIPESIPPEACTAAQVAPESPQVSEGCAAVQLCSGGEGGAVSLKESTAAALAAAASDPDVMAVADLTGEQFESALAAAKADGDLSAANIASNGSVIRNPPAHGDADHENGFALVAQDADEGEWSA